MIVDCSVTPARRRRGIVGEGRLGFDVFEFEEIVAHRCERRGDDFLHAVLAELGDEAIANRCCLQRVDRFVEVKLAGLPLRRPCPRAQREDHQGAVRGRCQRLPVHEPLRRTRIEREACVGGGRHGDHPRNVLLSPPTRPRRGFAGLANATRCG